MINLSKRKLDESKRIHKISHHKEKSYDPHDIAKFLFAQTKTLKSS